MDKTKGSEKYDKNTKDMTSELPLVNVFEPKRKGTNSLSSNSITGFLPDHANNKHISVRCLQLEYLKKISNAMA